MSRVHGLKHVEGFLTAALAEDDAFGTHTQRVLDQLALADFTLAFDIGRTGFHAPDMRLLRREILPNVLPTLIVFFPLMIAIDMLTESALSFLGLGDPLSISWGTLLQFAFQGGAATSGQWWWLVPPGLAIVLVVLAFTMCGFALDEVFNPRLRER